MCGFVCVCMCVFWCSALVCMSLLQAAFNSASTTPPCPSWAAKCSAVIPSCKDGGVSRQSGARKNTPIRSHTLSLSTNTLSLTHTRATRHTQTGKIYPRDRKHTYNYIILNDISDPPLNESNTSCLRPHALGA